MTQEQKQEFTRRISQENHSGLILVLCDMFELYVDDAETAYKNKEEDRYLFNMEQARRTMQELIGCFFLFFVCFSACLINTLLPFCLCPYFV